ncbi:MAG: rhomboid family intramembrane serine protease [Rikenellaceae bacterium]|nr:rhomboid family intramembrane serine protease [Rikenellaceae bacterium]
MQANGYFQTPPVVKNLIIINVLFFMAETLLPRETGNLIVEKLGLFFWQSDYFRPYQLITYMFLHGSIGHLFMNMFALWMFGRSLEYDLGPKRFLIYYMVTGIGAALIQLGVNWIEISSLHHSIMTDGGTQQDIIRLGQMINGVTIGASGAVFGILLAFGMLHPNVGIFIFLIPIPVKAKYFVIGYGVLELLSGVVGTSPGIAHFAHVGGMLWGYLLLRYWKKRGLYY